MALDVREKLKAAKSIRNSSCHPSRNPPNGNPLQPTELWLFHPLAVTRQCRLNVPTSGPDSVALVNLISAMTRSLPEINTLGLVNLPGTQESRLGVLSPEMSGNQPLRQCLFYFSPSTVSHRLPIGEGCKRPSCPLSRYSECIYDDLGDEVGQTSSDCSTMVDQTDLRGVVTL
ncbi:hypothetical protein BT69DRAFT_154516 [Atractiella rhizophila]|nr:hypothetical protein BT69DRAFT_154516 [Atractiella rhizophila]